VDVDLATRVRQREPVRVDGRERLLILNSFVVGGEGALIDAILFDLRMKYVEKARPTPR